MRDLLNKLINTITQGRVTRISGDSETYPSAQISSGRKVSATTRLLPYPLVGNPSSDALAVKLNLQGQEQNSASIFHDPKNRLRGLKEGEGGIHNSLTGSYILLMENSDIKMVSFNDLIANIAENVVNTIGGDLTNIVTGNVLNTITGNLTDTVTGNIVQTAANMSSTISGTVTITAPTINLVGAVIINGTLAMAGTGTATMKNIAAVGTLTSNGKNISDSHTHGGVQVGGGTTGGVT